MRGAHPDLAACKYSYEASLTAQHVREIDMGLDGAKTRCSEGNFPRFLAMIIRHWHTCID